MKFREQTAKKKSIRQFAGMFLAVTVLLAGSPYIAEAAEIVKDMDGTAYAQDAAGFVYQIPKGATTKKGCSIYMYTGEKSTVISSGKSSSSIKSMAFVFPTIPRLILYGKTISFS